MAQRLIVYYDGEHAAWLDSAGELVLSDLADAAAAAGAREAVVLIPGENVLVTHVRLPPIRQATRRLVAARYALEEQLATRVEDLHFALAGRAADAGETAVAVIERERMRATVDACRQAGLTVAKILPDALALAVPAAGQWRVATFSDRVLARTGKTHAFAAELSLWPALATGIEPAPETIALLAADRAAADKIDCFQGDDTTPAIEQQTVDDADAVFARVLADADADAPLDLRQGAFARTSAMRTWWQPFKLTAGLAAAWLVVMLATRGIEGWQLHQRVARLQAQSVAAFHDAFPKVQTINDLRVQAEQNIRRLRGGSGGGDSLFVLLQATAEVTATADGLRIRSLQYRDGAIHLSLNGDNVQTLESLRAGFARHKAVTLSVDSAQAARNGVQIDASVRSATT